MPRVVTGNKTTLKVCIVLKVVLKIVFSIVSMKKTMLLAYRGADDCGDDVAAAAGDDGCCGRVVRSRRTAK